jgi:hypothetical protein
MIDSIDEPPAPPSMNGILAVQAASRDGAAGVGSERPVLHNPHTSIAVLILFVGPLWRDPDIARLNIGELRKFRRQLLELQSGYLLI